MWQCVSILYIAYNHVFLYHMLFNVTFSFLSSIDSSMNQYGYEVNRPTKTLCTYSKLTIPFWNGRVRLMFPARLGLLSYPETVQKWSYAIRCVLLGEPWVPMNHSTLSTCTHPHLKTKTYACLPNSNVFTFIQEINIEDRMGFRAYNLSSGNHLVIPCC